MHIVSHRVNTVVLLFIHAGLIFIRENAVVIPTHKSCELRIWKQIRSSSRLWQCYESSKLSAKSEAMIIVLHGLTCRQLPFLLHFVFCESTCLSGTFCTRRGNQLSQSPSVSSKTSDQPFRYPVFLHFPSDSHSLALL